MTIKYSEQKRIYNLVKQGQWVQWQKLMWIDTQVV